MQHSTVGGDLHVTVVADPQPVASPVVHFLGPGSPPDPGFVGRAAELDDLLRVLAPPDAEPSDRVDDPVVVLSALSGLGGGGKSALARTAALTAATRHWFPGGVAWVDLHGYDPDPTAQIKPGQLWPALLTALGVDDKSVPVAEAARATAYHGLLNRLAAEGRRVLLVLDNVGTADQVEPLLPLLGTIATRHRILLTSRHTLAELPARLLSLDVLDDEAATELLRRTLAVRRPGDRRIDDQPEGCRRLVALCAGLPLALVIVGAILAAEPGLSVTALADELEDVSGRLAGLTYGPDLAVNKAFEVSYRRLNDDQRIVFTHLSAIPDTDASLPVMATVAGLPFPRARAAVRHLERAHLLEPVLPVREPRRWRVHDLVMLYARAQLSDEDAANAFERVLRLYRATTDIAWKRFVLNTGPPGVELFPTPRSALAWVMEERGGLVGTVARSQDRHAREGVLLAADLAPFLQRAHRVDETVLVAATAVDLATHDSVPERDRAVAWGNLGMALMQAKRLDEAIPTLIRAGALLQDVGDDHAEAITRINLGVTLNQAGRYAEARAVLDGLATTFHDLGDTGHEATALLNMGNALLRQEEFNEALATFESARTVFEGLEDPHGCGQTWGGIGSVHRELGRIPEAISAYRNACTALADSGDPAKHWPTMILVTFWPRPTN